MKNLTPNRISDTLAKPWFLIVPWFCLIFPVQTSSKTMKIQWKNRSCKDTSQNPSKIVASLDFSRKSLKMCSKNYPKGTLKSIKNHGNSIKKSTLQRYVPKSLQNRVLARFFRKIFENLLQKRPPKAPQNPLKIIENQALVPKGAQRRPRTYPGPPKSSKSS